MLQHIRKNHDLKEKRLHHQYQDSKTSSNTSQKDQRTKKPKNHPIDQMVSTKFIDRHF